MKLIYHLLNARLKILGKAAQGRSLLYTLGSCRFKDPPIRKIKQSPDSLLKPQTYQYLKLHHRALPA